MRLTMHTSTTFSAPGTSTRAINRPVLVRRPPRCGRIFSSAPEVTPAPSNDLNPEDLVGAAWDPQGILPPPTAIGATGHFARRERQRAAERAAKQQNSAAQAATQSASTPETSRTTITPLSSLGISTASVPISELNDAQRQSLSQRLAQHHISVDLSFPGVHICHWDPVVLTVEDFLSAEECDVMISATKAVDILQASKVGAGNVQSSTMAALNSRRTSSSALIDDTIQSSNADLDSIVTTFRNRLFDFLQADGGQGWGPSGKLPNEGQYCYESLQVAMYETGQYFLAHEDAFPLRQAHANGFQRHATFLVYLNDVAKGGATRFDDLGVAVTPKRGRALLFFPAFSDDTPDSRTLHTAVDAVDQKWVMQQWIACGVKGQQGEGEGEGGEGLGLLANSRMITVADEAGAPVAGEAKVSRKKAMKKGGKGGKQKKGFS